MHKAFISVVLAGEKVTQGMEQVTYEYKGKIYNFCCAGCIDEFKKDSDCGA